jgi:hypothetical protein
MTIQTPDSESPSFKIADQKISNLLQRLKDKRVCGCCTAHALALHAGALAMSELGSTDAAGMLEDLAATVRKYNIPAPVRTPSTDVH